MSDEGSSKAEFDGLCAFALSVGKKDVPGGENCSLDRQSKIYNFSNPVAKLLFRILPGRVDKAEKTWNGIC